MYKRIPTRMSRLSANVCHILDFAIIDTHTGEGFLGHSLTFHVDDDLLNVSKSIG